MDEIKEKMKITDAMKEPHAPDGLVENMVQRATAVELGRSALKQLMKADPELSGKDKLTLGATALIGRIAAVSWPKNARADEMIQQLSENGAYRKAAEIPADVLAVRISDGSFLKSLQPSNEQIKADPKQTTVRKDTEKVIPVI